MLFCDNSKIKEGIFIAPLIVIYVIFSITGLIVYNTIRETNKFLLLQIVCTTPGCKTSVKDIGHGTCRLHAPCRQVTLDEQILWNPDQCSTCSGKVAIVLDDRSPKQAKTTAKAELKAWGRGFHKNRPGLPFLTEEKWRLMLFPRTDKVLVYSGPNDKPTQDVSEQLDSLE